MSCFKINLNFESTILKLLHWSVYTAPTVKISGKPYLFSAFEQVHVLDFRWFDHNIIDYVVEHGITDVLMVNAVEIAVSGNVGKRYDLMIDKN